MDTVLSSTENYVERPYVVRLYEDAFEKGIEKAILVFWKKNSDWTAEQMADTFEISVEKAKQLQLTVTSGTE